MAKRDNEIRPVVYLLRFDRPVGNERKQARYYLGATYDLGRRLWLHRNSVKGSAICRAAVAAGIGFSPVWIWELPDRAPWREIWQLEKRLKRTRHNSRLLTGRFGGESFESWKQRNPRLEAKSNGDRRAAGIAAGWTDDPEYSAKQRSRRSNNRSSRSTGSTAEGYEYDEIPF